jgi:pimeloyl-ACP methyl ester carboxylesterase
MDSVRSADGTRIAVRAVGAADGPVIVCVHGYPDDSRLWDQVAGRLSDRFRVVAYDVRGAGSSDRPRRRASYRLERLQEDFAAVLDAVSPSAPVHLLAHDWGSIQSWHFVTGDSLRGRIASYTSISGPCLDHAGYFLRTGGRRAVLRQLLHSWYIYWFHLPWLPELGWRLGLGQRLVPAVASARLDDLVVGMELYRANILPRLRRPERRHTAVPVLAVSPRGDRYVGTPLQTEVGRWAPDLRVEIVDGGHWLPREQPELVARLAAEHIGS